MTYYVPNILHRWEDLAQLNSGLPGTPIRFDGKSIGFLQVYDDPKAMEDEHGKDVDAFRIEEE